MNSPLVRVLVAILKLLLRLVILAMTGEWVDLDKLGKKATQSAPAVPSSPAPERAAWLQRLQAAQARQPEHTRAWREHLADFAGDSGAALEQHLRDQGVALKQRRFVALHAEPGDLSWMRELRAHTRYWPLAIPPSAEASLALYATIARERALAFAEDVPGLLDRLRRIHGWPAFLPLPALVERPDLARGAFGVWLAPLVADVLATLQLGPGYAEAMLSRMLPLAPASAPGNALLDETPPQLLRLAVSLGTLEFLGYFDEGERLEKELNRNFGAEPELQIPVGPWSPLGVVRVPYPVWQAELSALLGSMLEDVQPALGGEGLLDAPGVAFLHAEMARAGRLSGALSGDGGLAVEEGSARDWLAAALLVWNQGNIPERELVRRLLRALRAPDPSAPAGSRAAGSAPGSAPGVRTLAEGLRQPSVMRDAIVLGALLGPRRTSLRKRP
ncbi:MAG: hypothetical protein QM778_36845 [Myxococcales bacterium]